MKTQIATFFFAMVIQLAVAQISFEPVAPALPAPQITHDFLKVTGSSVAFADVNGDGFPDVLITGDKDPTSTGDPAAGLYLNDGSGSYVRVPDVPFDKVYHGSIDFADIDGDGDQDVLITGQFNTTHTRTKLYKNDGNGNFTVFANEQVLQVVGSGDADFADIDGDGDVDLMLIGSNNQSGIANMYENDGSGNYTLIDSTPFTTVWNGTVDFTDVDGDNDPDLLITGTHKINSNNRITITELYLNNGQGDFTLDENTSFAKVRASTVNFADFDGDNDPDVFITGDSTYSGNGGQVAALYFNDGSGKFSIAPGSSFQEVQDGDVAVADVDKDGDQDILLTGYKGYNKGGNSAILYKNDGSGNFSLADDATFPKIGQGAVAFADVDGDGNEDVLAVGNQGSNNGGNVADLYINDGTGIFTVVPRSLFIEVGDKSFANNAAAFADVDNDGDQDVMISGKSDSTYANTVLYLNNGNGNWSMSDNTTFATLDDAAISFADVDNDGDQDVMLAGYGKFPTSSFKRLAALYKFDSDEGIYKMADDITFTGVTNAVIRFADVDNDGDQDVLIMGSSNSNTYSTKLYVNDGSGTFTLTGVTFTNMSSGDAAFADVNGDGYVDLFLTGYNAGQKAELYLNDGSGGFSLHDDQTFEKVYNSSVDFADVDGDNDMDLFVSGDGVGSYNTVGSLYINDGTGSFTLQAGSSFKGVKYSAMAFSDFDADGDPDIILTGGHNPGPNTTLIQICEIYINDGSGNFGLSGDSPFPGFTGVSRGRMAIANINGDNYEDVLFVGWSHSGRTSILFKNTSCESCVPDPCAGITCPEGQLCYEGGCYDLLEPDDTLYTDLGPNLIAPSGALLDIDAGPGFDIYNWSTGDTTQSILVNASGKYWVIAYDTIDKRLSTDTLNILIKANANEECADGLFEQNGYCFLFNDLCDEVDCSEGEVCIGGVCLPIYICDENSTNPDCFVNAPCDLLTCPDGDLCVTDTCYLYSLSNEGVLLLSGGLFTDSTGGQNSPISNTTIYLFNELQTEINGFVTTDGNGLYNIENLPPGVYKVYIDYPPYKVKGDGLITLKSDFNSTNLDIVLVNGEFELRLDYVTGLVENKINDESFTLYPNPTFGEIMLSSKVHLGEVDIRIMDVTGRLITQKTMNIQKSGEISIADLRNESPGLKIILLYSKGKLIYRNTFVYKSE